MQACIEIAPEGFPVAIRKSASKTTTQEQQRFTQLISQLIANGRYGQLVAIHADMSHDQHGSMGAVGAERFLSWHRDFLLRLEREMQQVDAAAFIPYWNWAADRTVPSWLADFHPDVPVPGRRHPLQVRRSLGRRGRLAAQWEVDALVQNPAISYTNFTSVLEGFHNEVHTWVGGTMGSLMTAPADALFWLHHSQIDRLWSLWQAVPGNAAKHPTLNGADAVLDPWGPDTWQTVQSITTLGYSYEVP
jgi:tyrosinase